MASWTSDSARELYNVQQWGEGYFDVDRRGRVVARPRRERGPVIALEDIIRRAQGEGLRLPILLRFNDILVDRIAALTDAFDRAMAQYRYQGAFTPVYPVKVNQRASVVREIVGHNAERVGLEAGSKPELLAVTAQRLAPGGKIVCNGYKDREYVRLALLARRLGLDCLLVVEKLGELKLILDEAANLGVRPALGVRMRLASLGQGKWQNTGGEKAKFGLTTRQVLTLVDELRAADLADSLTMLHFHMGSQISNVRDIQRGMHEAARYYAELCKRGLAITTMDVGGGLGVDYEGTASRSYFSMNYGLAQYAGNIVQTIAQVCREDGLRHPDIITESGRALSAHHAVLVTNVTEVEQAPSGGAVPGASSSAPFAIEALRDVLANVNERAVLEAYHEAQHYLAEGQSLFIHGLLDLEQRAELDELYFAVCRQVYARLRPHNRAHRPVIDELRDKLADKYFCNFSVFRSVPDVWAIGQVFPIMPLHRLDEPPDRRARLEDLTCDSDGRIDTYVERDGLESTLPLHTLKPDCPYHLGLFMVGAYQETLGDIHNLFGATDSVNVRLTNDGYRLEQLQRGDTADRLLAEVGFDADELFQALTDKIGTATLSQGERERALETVRSGLAGYTYLHED